MTYTVTINVRPAKPKRKPVTFHISVEAANTRAALIAAIKQAKDTVPTRKVMGHPRIKVAKDLELDDYYDRYLGPNQI